MTTCARCGHRQDAGRFCTGCGAPVEAPVEAPVATPVPTDVTATAVQPAVPGEPTPAPAPGREVPRWLPWLLAWLLLAVVAAMVGWSIGSDEDPRTAPATATGGSAPPAGQPSAGEPSAGEPSDPPEGAADVTATATAAVPQTAPPNRSVDGEEVTYDAAHLLDGDPATAWRMPGDGTGAVLTFTLPQATRLASVGLVNGYAKVDGPVNWYPRNRRVTTATWGFDDGTVLEQELIESPAMQTVGVPDVTTSTVTLTLTTVSPPGAEDGRDFTPVSDVRLIGTAG